MIEHLDTDLHHDLEKVEFEVSAKEKSQFGILVRLESSGRPLT